TGNQEIVAGAAGQGVDVACRAFDAVESRGRRRMTGGGMTRPDLDKSLDAIAGRQRKVRPVRVCEVIASRIGNVRSRRVDGVDIVAAAAPLIMRRSDA